MSEHILAAWKEAENALALDPGRAESLFTRLTHEPSLAAAAQLRLSLIAQERGDLRAAVSHTLGAARITGDDPAAIAMLCKRLFSVGEVEEAIRLAASPALRACNDIQAVAETGKLMTDAFQPELARQLLRRARTLGLDSPGLHYLLGLCDTYLGELDTAETAFERCLQAAPGFARAHWARSKLRRWSESDNHVACLRRTLATCRSQQDLPLLQYALFKELDDIGDVEGAWAALESGMRARRAQVRYDPAQERALFQQLMRVGVGTPPSEPDAATTIPVFIVGMPRSGTTLLERILGNHPDVADAGELHDLVLQLRWICNRAGGAYMDLDLAERIDAASLPEAGQRYLSHTRLRGGGRRFQTDKMPANFANVGYILQALPHARVVHMVRNDMDTCFSNLKELFAGAYPHTYDQLEMAGHLRAYRGLMQHWHEEAPGRVLDVRYERLVAEPDVVAAELVAFCGLAPVDGLARVEARAGAVATASSVQVREGIHSRNVGQWRRYGRWLEPMQDRLSAGT